MAEDTNRPSDLDQIAQLTFEEALQKIEEIVQELESGRVGLDDAIVRYELGVRLIRHCRQILARAEKRVRQLVGEDDQGNPVLVDFVEESAAVTGPEEFEDPPPTGSSQGSRSRRKRKKRSAKVETDDGSLFDEADGPEDVPF